MKTLLIRSKTTDHAIFKMANSLHKYGLDVELLVWDRQNSVTNEDYLFKIHKFGLKAPYNSYWTLFYLPIWWIYEMLFLFKNQYEVIHSSDLDTLWPAIIAKILNKTKLYYTIYDFYSDNMYNVPRFLRKILAFLEIKGIGYSNILFLVDKSRYEQIKGAKIDKIVYIYNSPQDINVNKMTPKKIPKNFTVFYAGSLESSRGLKYMIRALKEIKSIDLIIAGTGVEEEMIKKESQQNSNIKFVGWLDHDTVLRKCLEADVLFAFYDPKIPNHRFASPNKLFESMMCGKPIITNSNTSASELVKLNNCGFVLDYGDVSAIKKTLIKLRDDPNLCKNLGKNGRVSYERKYNYDIMENRLLKAYRLSK